MQDLFLLRIQLISIIAEVLFFGAFCILYPVALWILVHRQHRRRRPRYPTLWLSAIVTMMFLCAGTYLVLDVRLIMLAFVNHSTTSGGPTAYFNNPGAGDTPFLCVPAAIFAFLTLLGDGFMAYRVFVVWGGGYISIVLPGLLVIGDLVTTVLFGKALLQGGPPTSLDVVFTSGARSPLIAYFLMTLFTNFGTTSLLLGRLYWHDRRARRHLSENLYDTVPWRVMKTIVQSQAVYSVGLIFNLVTFLANSNLVLVTNAILPPLIGISFTLIITRIGFSEALGVPMQESTAVSGPMHFIDAAHASSPMAIDMFISQSSGSEDMAEASRTKSPTNAQLNGGIIRTDDIA